MEELEDELEVSNAFMREPSCDDKYIRNKLVQRKSLRIDEEERLLQCRSAEVPGKDEWSCEEDDECEERDGGDEEEEEEEDEETGGDGKHAEHVYPQQRRSLSPSGGGDSVKGAELDEFGFRVLRNPGLEEALQLREQQPVFDEIGGNRYLELCRSLDVTPIRSFLQELNEGVVNLQLYGVSPRSMRAVSDALMYNPSVHTLNLTGNWMSTSAAYYVSELMLRENNTLRVVILRHCNLRSEGAAVLAEGIELNRSVQRLDLAHNGIGNLGVLALQTAITFNEELIELDLSANDLGAEAAASLAKAMRQNTTLAALRLARNNLYENTPKGVRLLLRALQARENFLLLDLAWNALGQDAAVPIRAFLVKSPSVQEVVLDHNRFPGSAIDIIKVGVAKSTCLEYLYLGFNPMEAENAMNLLRACQGSQTMRLLDLSGIRVNADFLPLKARLEESKGLTINIEGALSDYEIKGPNLGEMMLKRARYEGFKPKKKKRKRNFGHLLLEMDKDGNESVLPEQFTQMAKKKKIKVRQELLRALYEQFEGRKKHVNVSAMLECYMHLFPETELPPPRPKKEKKKKKKKRKQKSKANKIKSVL